jgi:hypothetical protein
MTPSEFITRWKTSGGAELANSQSFLKELCTLLDVPHPEPTQPDESLNAYTFEKAVEFNNGDGTTSSGRIDLYRKGMFVLESKQGTERREAELDQSLAKTTKSKRFRAGTSERSTPAWELAMTRAREQARRYAQAIPDEWPPFLIVADVGHCFDLYADFTQSGKNYVPFPDPRSYRIKLDDLADEQVRTQLRDIWLHPHSLDPSKRAAKVTRELAASLAKLAKSLEGKHQPEEVAQFLMRCLFTMFAEDVEIGGLKKGDFTKFLEARRGKLDKFVPMLSDLWRTMDTGGFSVILETQLKKFNGGLFESQTVLPLVADQLELLIEAAKAEWTDVEPAIFGTLLERALDPVERHKLGAHYTPRAYVERLVMPTIIEPLREEWGIAYATAVQQHESGKPDQAIRTVREFHEKLCETRILDPACGSGNFLYVSLELMKRLEGEVLKTLQDFGDRQQVLLTIDPHQFLGIEVNPRAAAITDLVLWIGYLQWHFRTRGKNAVLNEPIIRKFHNIECRDAVLAWDAIEPVTDEAGNPVTRWDGRTTKPHPVTGEEVPDETARVQEVRYINPRKAEWPKADYIVGNPPFIGAPMMRTALGDGYTVELRRTHQNIPDSCDYVMYWWDCAANLLVEGKLQRFGFIATNSLRQTFNRRILDRHLADESKLRLLFALPDHPWIDSGDGAAVRISMTVGGTSSVTGKLLEIVTESGVKGDEHITYRERNGELLPDLTIGPNVSSALPLGSNVSCAFRGMSLIGTGFVLDSVDMKTLMSTSAVDLSSRLKRFRNGKDLAQRARDVFVIDVNDLNEKELLEAFPAIYQWLSDRVKVEREAKRNTTKDTHEYARRWWTFGKPRQAFRDAAENIETYFATPMTAKHRYFVVLSGDELPDQGVIAVTLNDTFYLGVLSSRVHVVWSLATGGRLGVGNDSRYNNSRCFETFPFPDLDQHRRGTVRQIANQLDAHRKRQQALHPDLTMTGMYNVLEKLRSFDQRSAISDQRRACWPVEKARTLNL